MRKHIFTSSQVEASNFGTETALERWLLARRLALFGPDLETMKRSVSWSLDYHYLRSGVPSKTRMEWERKRDLS
jgi:hypothetical protein